MPANKRVFYAIHRAGIAPDGSSPAAYLTIHGLQSIGITTTFNLEQVFEIGQLAIYENIEGIPDVEVSTEKVLDGYAPIYTLATQGSLAATLVGRSNAKCTLGMAIYPDTQVSASGTAVSSVQMSGLYVSSFSYEMSVEGHATESCSLVGNNKVWVGQSGHVTESWDSSLTVTNNDAPTGAGGVQRREDILFGSGVGTSTICPLDVPGLDSNGYNVQDSSGIYGVHFQRVSVSVDLGREDMFELGRQGTYHKFVNFPTEVTSEWSILSVSGDMVPCYEDSNSLTDRAATIYMREGLVIDLGSMNKLSSVGMSGGDASGGNQELTFTYTNYNDCTVQHPNDPTVGLRP